MISLEDVESSIENKLNFLEKNKRHLLFLKDVYRYVQENLDLEKYIVELSEDDVNPSFISNIHIWLKNMLKIVTIRVSLSGIEIIDFRPNRDGDYIDFTDAVETCSKLASWVKEYVK